jgi:hypothetical protein
MVRSWKSALIALILAITGFGTAYAIVGCITDIQDLVPRADVIIVGTVEEMDRTTLSPCTPGHWGFGKGYNRCGHLPRLKVRVDRTLKGKAPGVITAWVPAEASGLLLSCDDRPPVNEFLEKIIGSRVTLFMEQDQDNLWTLDGPNSIHDREMDTWVSVALKTLEMKMTMELEPRVARPGQAIVVTHRLSIAGGKAFHGCFGVRDFWRFASSSSTVFSKDDEVYSPKCLQEFSLESGKEIEWKQTVVVPLDAALGETQVRARIQILADPHCPDWSCAHAFLESEPAKLQLIEPTR